MYFTFSQLLELGDKRGKRTSVAALETDIEDWEYVSKRLDLFAETTKAFIRALAARKRVDASEKFHQLAKRVFKGLSEGYRQGKFRYLDVLDAQRTLFDAQAKYIEALANYHEASVEVERLIGQRVDEAKVAKGKREEISEKKNRGKSIYISSFIILLLLAGLAFWRFGNYEVVVVRGEAETEEHEGHEREQHAGEISEVHNKAKDESNQHTPGELVRINDLQRKKLDIKFGTARPGRLLTTIDLPGEIVMDEDHLAHIMPLLPGVVREVRKKLGETVRQGDVMAVIESRELADTKAAYLAALERVALSQTIFTREEQLWRKGISAKQEYLDAKKSLSEAKIEHRSAEQKLRFLGFSDVFIEDFQKHLDRSLIRYVITAPIDGTMVQKHITLGEKVGDDTEMFTLADLSHVWVDLSVPQKDLVSIKIGQRTRISLGFGTPDAEGKISYVSPMANRKTRTALARVVLPNPDRRWRPGLFVKAQISVGEVRLPLVVPKEALQHLENENVVFVEAKGGYEPKHVSVGRSDGSNVEILSGLFAGERYVAKGGFELKAVMMTRDLGAHAGHGH